MIRFKARQWRNTGDPKSIIAALGDEVSPITEAAAELAAKSCYIRTVDGWSLVSTLVADMGDDGVVTIRSPEESVWRNDVLEVIDGPLAGRFFRLATIPLYAFGSAETESPFIPAQT